MKKNMMKLAFAAALAVAVGVTAYQAQEKEMMSDVALENVEALAQTEGGVLDMYSCHYYGCQFAFFMQCHVYRYGQYKGVCDGYRGN